MCKTPVYVAAGRFNPVVLICKFSASVRVPGFVNKMKKNWLKSVRLLSAASGLVPVKAVKAPPLKLPDTLAEGILSLAPSVSPAAGLVKYAYSAMLPKTSGSLQLVEIHESGRRRNGDAGVQPCGQIHGGRVGFQLRPGRGRAKGKDYSQHRQSGHQNPPREMGRSLHRFVRPSEQSSHVSSPVHRREIRGACKRSS